MIPSEFAEAFGGISKAFTAVAENVAGNAAATKPTGGLGPGATRRHG